MPHIEWVDPEEFCQRYKSFCQFEHTGEGGNLGDIVKLWLTQSPPFAEHKPPQFQDAMAFLSLHHWAAREEIVVHVVAKDPDWVSACKTADWCVISDLGALVAKLRAPIPLDDEQTSKLSDEIEVRMVDALESVAPLVTNRPGRTYDVGVREISQMRVSIVKVRSDSVDISATFRFEATAGLNISDRHGREVNCEPQIFGEIEVALEPGYIIQDLRVVRWSFSLPDLRTLDPREIDRRWFLNEA